MWEIFERIEVLKYCLKNYQGNSIGIVHEWQDELRKLRKEVKNGAVL